ncbi:MAG: hypothetical protein GY754_12150 [bacterium]|nr:hypothetical protein [bacterium]
MTSILFYKESLPHRALRPFIRCYYYCHSDSPENGVNTSVRFPSDGGAELIFTLKNNFDLGFESNTLKRISGTMLLGPYGRSLFTNAEEENSTLAVRFHPGRMAPFFLIPARDLRDRLRACPPWHCPGQDAL